MIREIAQTFEPPNSEVSIRYTVEQPIDKWLNKHFAARNYSNQ